MFLPVYTETSVTNYPVTRRHIQSVMVLNAVDHIRNETGGLEARIMQKLLKHKILMEYLERNIRKWEDNIKMDIKESSFFLNYFITTTWSKARLLEKLVTSL